MGEGDEFVRPDASDLPTDLAPGSVVLVIEPAEPAVVSPCLQLLDEYATPEDVGIVVTTTDGADRTAGTVSALATDGATPHLGVVDTVSLGQNVTAFHRAVPTVFTPEPADLARVGVAIDNLSAQLPPAGASHLVVRSVTSFFGSDDGSTVLRGIERTFETWTDDGVTVLGADFTDVDEATLAALSELADAVVRVEVTGAGDHRLRYLEQPSR